jgi:hypothetical protein
MIGNKEEAEGSKKALLNVDEFSPVKVKAKKRSATLEQEL